MDCWIDRLNYFMEKLITISKINKNSVTIYSENYHTIEHNILYLILCIIIIK